MIKVKRIAHATFETPDLGKAIDYYTQVNGLILAEREQSRAFLTTRTGILSIQLERGSQSRCARLAFELDNHVDLASVRKALAAKGIQCDKKQDPIPGISNMISLLDPNGTTIELFTDWKYISPWRDGVGIGPLKLGHVAFFTPDPGSLAEFYQQVLGFRVSDWIEDFFVFMRCGPDHHSVNFLRGDRVRMHHVAFELKDIGHLGNSCDLLAKHKIPLVWGPLRFGPGHNLAAFHRDHDNNLVEFFAELDQMKDETLGYFDPRPWHRDMPQRPKVWNLRDDPVWGPPPPVNFM
jgi:catechol 2,3-dioxygenase-like lactoylglutathione lyase family enzyme